MVQNKQVFCYFYEESECSIFRKREDRELEWIYIQAGYHDLSGSKKTSLPECLKNSNTKLFVKKKKYW